MKEKKTILIAAHRGTNGGSIIQNTIPAYENAIRHGADIIEMDAAQTTDGVFYAFHDGQEPLILGISENIRTLSSEQVESMSFINSINHRIAEKVNRFDDVLDYLKGKEILLNIDRSWFYWEDIIDLINKHDMFDQIILKSPVEEDYLDYLAVNGKNIMYMPIVKTMEDLELVLSKDLNLLAVELIFNSPDHPLIAPELIKELKSKGIMCWGNPITLDDRPKLAGEFKDNNAIMNNPDDSWGWLIDHGFDVLQTDWPMLLRQYVDGRKKYNN